MAIVVTVDGRRAVAGLLRTWLAGLKYSLFVNDYVPTATSPLSDFSQATFSGFVRRTPKNWRGPGLDPSNNAVMKADPLNWTVGAGGGIDLVYGYFVVDTHGYCVYAERNVAGPVPMNVVGATFTVFPLFAAGALC